MPRGLAVRLVVAALCATVLTTAVYWSFERVRVRIVTQPQVAAAPVLPVALTVDERLHGAPTVFVLRIRAGAEPLDLTVALDGEQLGEAHVPAGREKRLDLAVPQLPREASTLTLAGSHAGWTLGYLEIANLHGYVGPPLRLVVVPRQDDRHGVPLVAGLLAFMALALMLPRLDWPLRALRWGHGVAAGFTLAVFALATLAPHLSSFRTVLATSAFVLGVLILYLRPVWLASARIIRVGMLGSLAQREVARLPRPAEWLTAAAGFTLLVAIFLHPQVRDFYSVPDLGDPLFSVWRIGWVVHQMWADPRHLFDANIFYPERGTLTFSDSIILPALTVWPLLKLGVHPLVAYNLLLLSGFVLSGLATYVLMRGLGFGRGAAWVSGVIFVIYPYRLDHYPHLELQMAQWMPLAVLGTHRVMATGSWRWAGLTAVLIAAQWYSSMYYALFLSAYLAVFAFVLALAWRDWRRLVVTAGVVVAGAVMALPLARAYSGSIAARGERPVDAIEMFSATPADYLQPNSRSLHYGQLRERGTPERELFPGVLPIVLAAAGAAPPWTPTRLGILASGLVAFDGSLGLNGLLYPWMYEWLSPFRSIRVPARFAILVGLTFAVLGGIAIERWRSRLRRVPPGLVAAAMTLVLVAEAWPALRLVPVWSEPPPIYGSLGPDSGAVLMEYPISPDPPFFHENLPYMYFSVWHATPMVNGYSGFMSERYEKFAPGTRGFPGGDTLEHLRQAGVTHISVVCALDGPVGPLGQRTYDPRRCEPTIAQLEADPRVRLVVKSVWQGAPALLYAIRPTE